MSRLRYHTLRVLDVIEETADARSIVFDIPPELQPSFAYKPGQHLQLHVPCGDKPLPRCYSLSSTPTSDEPLRVTVKRVADGRASNWLCSQLKAGDTLEVMPPAGVFTPRSLDVDFLMFAGGSGITPVYSIIRSALKTGKGRIRLIYANRDERSIIFGRELAELSRQFPRRLQIIHWLDSVQGVPSQEQLIALCEGLVDIKTAECFICGPGVFMDATAAALHSLGVPNSRVHIERFVSLPEDADDMPAAPAPVAGTAETDLTVEIDGKTHELKVPPGQLIIETMEAAGLEPPFSCRAGACAACMCKLEEGEVELLHNHVLGEGEMSDGWILACQAVAKSPKVKISYPT